MSILSSCYIEKKREREGGREGGNEGEGGEVKREERGRVCVYEREGREGEIETEMERAGIVKFSLC